jgi:hypothetical protein
MRTGFALALVVAASCGVSLVWVFAVPIYQSPDEPAHLDYALAIYAHGRPFKAQHTSFEQLPPYVHPYTFYLQDRTRAFEIAHSPGAKVEPGYGTADYFARLDRAAPPADSIQVAGPNHLAAVYPFGYYTLLAGWIALVRQFSDSLTVTFFAARIFSVLLLAITLPAMYGTLRLMNFGRQFSLLLTTGIGLFPLTSFVSAYVQPDNLSWTLLTLSIYLALRFRRFSTLPGAAYEVSGLRRPLTPYVNPGKKSLVALGLCLGALIVTKVHFFLCAAIPIAAMLGAELVRDRAAIGHWLRTAALSFLPSLLLGSVYLWSVWGTQNYFSSAAKTPQTLGHYWHNFHAALRHFFVGQCHDSFWGTFGWMDASLLILDPPTTLKVRLALRVFAILTLVLFGIATGLVGARLVRLVRHDRAASAMRVALGNPVANGLFLFTALLFALFMRTDNRFFAQGRNWLPVMLPVCLVGIVYAARAWTWRPLVWLYSATTLLGLLCYDAVGGYYALKTIHGRFYLPFQSAPTRATPLSPEPVDATFAAREPAPGTIGPTWVCSSGGSYLAFALDRPRFVHGVRLEFKITQPASVVDLFRVVWRAGEAPFPAPELGASFLLVAPAQISAAYGLIASDNSRGVTVWMNGPVREFRIYPAALPCTFEVKGITILD